MYKVELESSYGGMFTIYFNNNLTVYTDEVKDFNGQYVRTAVRVEDGIHNNGGYEVKHSYEEVIAKIDAAIMGK